MQRVVQVTTVSLLILFTTTSAFGGQRLYKNELVLDEMNKKDRDDTRRAYECAYSKKVGSRRGLLCALTFVGNVEKYEGLDLKTVLQKDTHEMAKTTAKSIIQMHVDHMLAEALILRQEKMSDCIQSHVSGDYSDCMNSVHYGKSLFEWVDDKLSAIDVLSEEEIEEMKQASVPEY